MSDEGSPEGLTQVLQAAGRGDPAARDMLAAQVYHDLKQTAARMMRQEPLQTLQATALVNEAYLQLFEGSDIANSPNRAYFFAAAGQAMRRILVDAARRRMALKRGAGYQRHGLDEILDRYEVQKINLVELDEAIVALEKISPRQANVVHLRWFMEQSVKEISEMLGISVSTVEQDWRMARAFLKRQLMSDE